MRAHNCIFPPFYVFIHFLISAALTANDFWLQRFVEQVILGYLRLLVNSRDELALARVIDVPHRGLDHRAFTDVKHEAKRRGLSMYQVQTSAGLIDRLILVLVLV